MGKTILSKTVLAAIGALSVTRENAERVIDELIQRGELDKSQRAQAVREAAARFEAEATEVAKKVRQKVSRGVKELRNQAARMSRTTEDEISSLRRSVEDLKAELSELKAQFGKRSTGPKRRA